MALALVKSINAPRIGRKETGFEGMTNQELIEYFLNKQKSDKTKPVYRGVIEKFDKFVNKPFEDVSKKDMEDFSLLIDHFAPATKLRYYATIRAFFTWLAWAEIIKEDENPSKGSFKKYSQSKDLASKCLAPSEVEAIREVARTDARKYAMIATIATTGMRISELCAMKWSDMFKTYNKDTGNEDWCLRIEGKGGKIRYAFLVEGTLKALLELRKNGGFDPSDDTYVFLRLYKKEWGRMTETGARIIIESLAKKAGVKDDFTPHWFRHTFLSQVLANGASPRDTQFCAGHSSLRTTEIYLEHLGTNVSKFYPVLF
jgi:integrase/recombinase XerD